MSGKILLLDNAGACQQTVTQALLDEQFDILCTDDGMAAVCILNESLPDLLIADMALLKRNGFALCRYIKEEPEFQTLPIVLLDSHFDAFTQSLAFTVGASAYLKKPCESAALLEIIRQLLQSRTTVDNREESPSQIIMPHLEGVLSENRFIASSVEDDANKISTITVPKLRQTASTSLLKTIQPDVGQTFPKSRGIFVVAFVLAIVLAILLRNHSPGFLPMENASPISEPMVSGTLLTGKPAVAKSTENQEIRDSIPIESPLVDKENTSSVDNKEKPKTSAASAAVPEQNASDSLPRKVRNERLTVIRGERKSSKRKQGKTGQHFGNRTEHSIDSDEDIVERIGRKVGGGIKRLGKILRKMW